MVSMAVLLTFGLVVDGSYLLSSSMPFYCCMAAFKETDVKKVKVSIIFTLTFLIYAYPTRIGNLFNDQPYLHRASHPNRAQLLRFAISFYDPKLKIDAMEYRRVTNKTLSARYDRYKTSSTLKLAERPTWSDTVADYSGSFLTSIPTLFFWPIVRDLASGIYEMVSASKIDGRCKCHEFWSKSPIISSVLAAAEIYSGKLEISGCSDWNS